MSDLSIEEFYKDRVVEDDFDEEFYKKEYPETLNFYQPYCESSGIDDRHRLYFHWCSYGENKYKSLAHKILCTYIPNISPRGLLKKNKLAVITTFFNPCNYVNLQYNYIKFVEGIRGRADLFTAELSFNNKFFTDPEFSLHISGNRRNVLWQKERLLNIVLESLPKEYTDIAWIDSDIIFNDPYWHDHIPGLLSNYKVIQLFGHAYRVDRNGIPSRKFESLVKYYPYGVTGFAWAARREVLDEIKFLDNQILGGADYIMTSAFIRKEALLNRMYINDDNTKDWLCRAKEVVDGSTWILDTDIKHLYHGETTNRSYIDRHKIITNTSNFSIKDGLWICKNKKSRSAIKRYFLSRKEDDNIIKVNNIFHNVYVLNLDHHQDKMDIVGKKLSDLGINYERFSGVDGESLECPIPEKQGVGLLDNKYALGCYLSHLSIVRDAKEKGYKRILILEDDVMFAEHFNAHFQKLRNLSNWKLLYFGGSQHSWEDISYIEDFYIANKTYGTFAYGIEESLYDEILNSDPKYNIDRGLTLLQEKHKNDCYVFYPYLCISNVSSSTIRESREQNHHNAVMKWNLLNYF